MVSAEAASGRLATWAVIDIGSNSVRLVMYEGPPRSPIPIFNEKVLCGLGDRDPDTDTIRPEAATEALSVLTRFRAILDETRPPYLHVFATAGVRDAADGPAFLDEIREIGFEPRLLTGDEEARLAALGILSGAPEILDAPEGALGGDIGGGSLELCHIIGSAPGGLGPRISLPLGGLRLSTDFGDDREGAAKHIARTLAEVDWLKDCPAQAIYAVGGAWRALGRIAIAERSYPLHILDYFSLSRNEVIALCTSVAAKGVAAIAEIDGVQRRRAPTLPFAAMVMQALFDLVPLERLVISASGVREGILFDALGQTDRTEDPLFSMTEKMSTAFGISRTPNIDTMTAFLAPLDKGTSPARHRLLSAASELGNSALAAHPDERAGFAARAVMGMPLRGLDHIGRGMLAAALFYRHGGSPADITRHVPETLLPPDDAAFAQALGLGLRLAFAIDPAGADGLRNARLESDGETLVLHLEGAARRLWGRNPEKRLGKLADFLGLENGGVLP